jgi:hypothetical protein
VRFKIDELSFGVTNDGFLPTSDEENVQPAGCVFEPATKLPKS